MYECVRAYAFVARTAWCSFFALTPDGRDAHTLSRVFDPQECVWRLFCPCWHLCSQRTLFVCSSALALQRPLICPHRHLPFALGYVFNSQEHIQTVGYALCAIRPVCGHRWHHQFTAHTARCSFLPAQPRWTSSTQFTPHF